MNEKGVQRIPFLFTADYELRDVRIFELSQVNQDLLIQMPNYSNVQTKKAERELEFSHGGFDLEKYRSGFDFLIEQLNYGNSFLANYTCRTPIETNFSLEEIFHTAVAPYKLYIPGECVVFSPEAFVSIEDGIIRSYPMKGTIDARIPDAEARILSDLKETAEHYTIVDLIRNDLSMVASKVEVPRFRFITGITSRGKKLLQVSSEITGEIRDEYAFRFGSIFERLLPAGSISGAPKRKTVEIIRQAEGLDRGLYTGIFGVFDGKRMETAVAIRYIENDGGQLFYRSGGGITTRSECLSEYREMLDKIYVPTG